MRIKHLVIVWLPVILLAACTGEQNKFKVVGHVENMPEQTVYLEELNVNDIVILDSGKSNGKGDFELSAKAPEQGLYRLRFEQNKFILLSIDKGTVKINADWAVLEQYTVTGSDASSSLRGFVTVLRKHMNDYNTMGVVLDSMKARGNDSLLADAKSRMEEMNMGFTRYIELYADTTKYLPNALFAVNMLNPAVEKAYIDVFVKNLGTKFADAKLARDYIAKYNGAMAAQGQQTPAAGGVMIGNTAPEITLPGMDGKEVSLSSFKGKYVLLDFWASWCGPCRRENPNVVEAFNKFKDKNFTVLGVSLDNDKEKWEAAIEKDNLTWTHISDLKGWESVAARVYGIESIPSNFLIGPDGKILARDLREDALEEKLEELLK